MRIHHAAYPLAARPAIAAALVLLVPLLAMQFTESVKWTLSDFVFAGILVLGVGIAWELVLQKVHDSVYRTAAGLALAGTLLLTWSNAAVGITDSPADTLYLGVAAVGLAGAFVARFRPAGMACTMLAMAVAQTVIGAGALLAGAVPAHSSAFEVLGITGFFVAWFAGAAWLFREAVRGGAERGAI
jgi:hypothetical protein